MGTANSMPEINVKFSKQAGIKRMKSSTKKCSFWFSESPRFTVGFCFGTALTFSSTFCSGGSSSVGCVPEISPSVPITVALQPAFHFEDQLSGI